MPDRLVLGALAQLVEERFGARVEVVEEGRFLVREVVVEVRVDTPASAAISSAVTSSRPPFSTARRSVASQRAALVAAFLRSRSPDWSAMTPTLVGVTRVHKMQAKKFCRRRKFSSRERFR
jgi:hypothetical protein